jgi:hypothetical protein
MKKNKLTLPLLALITGAPAQAALAPLLDTFLNSLSIFAKTSVTTGDSATVYGSFLAGAGATLDTNSSVTGDIFAGAGGTLGGNSTVTGSFEAGAGATLGASTKVGGNLLAGAAATLGADAKVAGNLVAGDSVTKGVGAQVQGTTKDFTAPTFTGIPSQASVDAQAKQVSDAQANLRNMTPDVTLAATIGGTVVLNAGTYSASALTSAADTVFTLDARGLANQLWVFNIDGSLVTGASTKVNVINGGADSSVIWNVGGFTNLGASTSFLGTIFANSYVNVAASATVIGPGTSCGGVFSSASAVVLGAGAKVGSSGCTGASDAYWYALNTTDLQSHPTLVANSNAAPSKPAATQPSPGASQVPEPATPGLVFAGLAAIALTSRRRRNAQPTR